MYLKRNGRVTIEGFENLQNAPKITPDRALLLFRCCGSLLPDIQPTRRHQLMLDLKARFKPPFIDISHFNTLLLVQNENGIPFDPSEALSELSNMGLEPNRVTYQHLIERYALSGDLSAANAILSHMKEAGMPVNEWIFGSLISCHTAVGDFEGAKGVLEVMKTAGLEVGSEAHITYISGVLKYRAKDLTPQELESLFEDAKLKEITFCDHDIFQVLSLASSLERIDLSDKIISYLPRKSGYYQEMRNHIPGLIFNGHLPVALSLYRDFASNIQMDDSGLSKKVYAEFIPTAMVRSNGRYSAEEIEGAIDGLLSEDVGVIFAEALATSIEEGHNELSKSLGDIMHSRKLFDRRNFIPYIKRRARVISSENGDVLDEMSGFVSSLVSTGIQPSMQSYAQDILPPIISNRTSMEGRTVNAVRDLLNKVKEKSKRAPPYSDIGNACVQHHLNLEKESSFMEALRMLSSIRGEWVLPISWKLSLARSYLATNNLEILSSFFFFCLRDQLRNGESANRNLAIWDCIPLIHSFGPRYDQKNDPDLLVKNVLSHLASLDITPPKEVSKSWKRTLEDPSVLELIESLPEPTTWSAEADRQFNEHIFTDLFGKIKEPSQMSDSRKIHNSLIKSIAEERFLEGADRILKVLKTSDFIVAPREVHDLILGLCQGGHSKKALEVFNSISEQSVDSKIFAATASHLLGQLISKEESSLWKGLLLNSLNMDKLITKSGVDVSEYFSGLSLHLDEDASKKTKLSEVKSILEQKGIVSSEFKFMEEDRRIHSVHNTVVDLIAENKVREAEEYLQNYLVDGGVIYGGTCIQMAGALSKVGNKEKLKDFLLSLSEEKVHARQTWNGFFVSLLNLVVEQLEDVSGGHALLEELYEAGSVPSKVCKAYYNTKVGLLLKENKVDEALELTLQASDNDIVVKNHELMKIFAEAEDLEKLQKVLDVGIGILGEVNSLYALIRCFLDLGKFPQVKKLLETPGFRYMPSNVENLVDHLIRSENTGALEIFVNYSRNLFACDRDYLYSKLLEATPVSEQGEKASEIWINLQEEGHIPSPSLKRNIATALRSADKYVPFAEEERQSGVKSLKAPPRSSSATSSPFLQSLSGVKDNPKAALDLLISLNESERENILSTRVGIRTFSEVLKNADSDNISAFESILSPELQKTFFISRRKAEALILERKVDLLDIVRENPERIPSVRVISEVADGDCVRRLYDMKDSLSDIGKAIVITSALLKGEFGLVRDFMRITDRGDRSFFNFKRYIRGNLSSLEKASQFLESLKAEGLISELGGPIYSYILESSPKMRSSKDELSNIILELSRNKVDLSNMSTAALRICADNTEDEVMKRNMTSLIENRSKA
eukprot:TRINITY_DN5115_c0_g1_i1.p1 TRINITY_DN5115_c0_g1~~TRINITY_DN5115_c0_g1_i1.p1  ORF type:complete len:1399 (-),score=436.44 TRINITY_DN5115_c0_g1_i1:131-4198(-)